MSSVVIKAENISKCASDNIPSISLYMTGKDSLYFFTKIAYTTRIKVPLPSIYFHEMQFQNNEKNLTNFSLHI